MCTESIAIRLAALLLLSICVSSYPSPRQCLVYTNNATIQSLCAENKKHVTTYMPPKKAIYYESHEVLRPPTPEIPESYYSQCPFDSHRDKRFYKDVVIPNRNRILMIRRLFGAFIDFARDYNLKWWVAHGGLIGWYYNEELLPWDTDVDVKVLYYDMMTEYSKFHGFVYKDRFLFELNPNHYYRGVQKSDVIDARFIDKTNGLYVDLTGVIYIPEKKLLTCKSPRYYSAEDLFPLRNVSFLGFDNVWFPNDPIRMMEKDYGKGCMEMKTWSKAKTWHRKVYDIEFYKWSEEAQVFITDPNPPSWDSVLKKKKEEANIVVESKQG